MLPSFSQMLEHPGAQFKSAIAIGSVPLDKILVGVRLVELHDVVVVAKQLPVRLGELGVYPFPGRSDDFLLERSQMEAVFGAQKGCCFERCAVECFLSGTTGGFGSAF